MNLDNLLNRLSEDYNLGYERARSEYTLEIEENPYIRIIAVTMGVN